MGLILMFLVPWIFGFTYYVFNFPLHQKLLAAYEKLQKAKRAHHWA